MAHDNPEQFEPYERTHRNVESMLQGRKPEPWPDASAEEGEILRVAGLLNAVGASPQPRPEFVDGLAQELRDISGSRSRQWGITRRGLLRGVASAAGLLAAGAAADRVVTTAGRPSASPGWVAVARAAEVAPGTAVRFLAAGRDGYLLNLDGRFSALSALCTHLPCVLQWSAGPRELICPCHQAQFAADGQHRPSPSYDRQLPALSSFPVKQVGPLIYVFAGDASGNQPNDGEEYS